MGFFWKHGIKWKALDWISLLFRENNKDYTVWILNHWWPNIVQKSFLSSTSGPQINNLAQRIVSDWCYYTIIVASYLTLVSDLSQASDDLPSILLQSIVIL